MVTISGRIGRPRRRWRRCALAGVGLSILVASPGVATPAQPALMPLPRSYQAGSGALMLTGPLAPSMTGCTAPVATSALARFTADLEKLAGVPAAGAAVPLRIRCLAADPHVLSIDAREGYRLKVADDGVTIEADGETGVVRALATLRQLVGRSGGKPVLADASIDDAPRFAWRGLMIDTARHFVSLATLKRQIDAMELVKLNVLHLHLSDNQGFRVESKLFPKLTQGSTGQFFTQAEIRDLVRYAGDRGVRIVPEFDMPGHNLALLAAYPEFAATPLNPNDPMLQVKGSLDPANEKTYRFVAALIGEMSGLFPDKYFHVGGDEAPDAAWKGNAGIEALKKAKGFTTKQQVEAYFLGRLDRMLAAHGKIPVGWDDVLDGPAPPRIVAEAWRTSNPVSTGTAAGHPVIVAAGYYLDHLEPAQALYAIDPIDPEAYSTMTAAELANARKNPVAAALVSEGLAAKPVPPLNDAQKKLVLGGEAPLWGEMVTDEMVDGRLWPRGIAVAESFWSPQALRKPKAMMPRLVRTAEELSALGLQDGAHRERMIARLAPDDPEPVATLVDEVAPVRLFAHSHVFPGSKKQQILLELADAASTDGLPARRFGVEVDAFLAGDRSLAPSIRSRLQAWAGNEAPYARVAAGEPFLESALPTAHDLAQLGVVGLEAMDAIDKGTHLSDVELADAKTLLERLAKFEAASSSLSAMAMGRQPPADLIILPAPDVRKLVDAASAGRP